ncbi:Rotatin [Dissostichus eleginoides]|uniref:Rotatin n=1 Tax=Dissostichus eleginoides TaxID=100907 RepID=A0AAD9BLA0_DISEL|nr:Rotatin [Dissostichus eleginoides]
MALLSCSRSAQSHAAKAGLIDSCVEQMKKTHSQLHLESIRPGKASHRRKEESYLKEVKLSVEILRSALYLNEECKCQAESRCMNGRRCVGAQTCSCVCVGGSGSAAGCKGAPSSSLMLCVTKLASGVASDNTPVQKLSFCLLANLAMSRDCRGLLQKNNFLQAFLSVPMPKAGGAEDGQQSILRVSGALEVISELALQRRHALLTLHNLCFCPNNKPHLLANDKAMKVLLGCLNSKEMETRSMGASALWALLHNNQRCLESLSQLLNN